MKPEYQEWVAAFAAREGSSRGRCKSATREMAAAFPELTIVRGHVEVPHPWGRRRHAWLVDAKGEIVDPSADQFPVVLAYDPWRPGDSVEVGWCYSCGGRIWIAVQSLEVPPDRPSFCSTECEAKTISEMNGGIVDAVRPRKSRPSW